MVKKLLNANNIEIMAAHKLYNTFHKITSYLCHPTGTWEIIPLNFGHLKLSMYFMKFGKL